MKNMLLATLPEADHQYWVDAPNRERITSRPRRLTPNFRGRSGREELYRSALGQDAIRSLGGARERKSQFIDSLKGGVSVDAASIAPAPIAASANQMPQHMQALARANHVRLARAALKRSVARGDVSVAEVVGGSSWETESMTLAELLTSQRRW